MSGLPCDNSQDGFVGDEIYEVVDYYIEEETKRLGRALTTKERNGIYRDYGAPIPTETYSGPLSRLSTDDEDDGEETVVQATTEAQNIEANPNQPDENESEDSSQSETIEVQFSEEVLTDSEPLSPLMEEYWNNLKELSQEFGVTATLNLPKRVPSTTTKTRFVFLEKGNSPTDSEPKETE